jgi:ABC-type branched-subunit amino acid transport system ATPase component
MIQCPRQSARNLLKSLSKNFTPLVALFLYIQKAKQTTMERLGFFIAIDGPNGAGKTTVISSLLEIPTPLTTLFQEGLTS